MSADPTDRFYPRAVGRKKKNREINTETDKLYLRPYPDVFSLNWRDGFRAGYDNEKGQGNLEWEDGFLTGQAEREWNEEEADRSGSSNA